MRGEINGNVNLSREDVEILFSLVDKQMDSLYEGNNEQETRLLRVWEALKGLKDYYERV